MKSCFGVLAFLAACAFVEAGPPRPATTWTPASSSDYDSTVRNTAAQCDCVVIHTAEGSYAGTISWFQNPAAQASSHYVISQAGEITQMVQDYNIAWTETYYNARSIGIECEGYAGDPSTWTPAMLSALEDLVAWLCYTYNIRTVHPNDDANTYGGYYTNYGLIGHYQIQTPGSAAAAAYGTRTDPGSYFPWASFVDAVNARINGGPAPAPTNLQATADSATQVTFSWDASQGATGYYVDVAESSADLESMTGTFHNHDNGTATSYAWAGLSPSTTYYWRVWAYNASGGNHGYPAGPVTTPGLPPSEPTNLQAAASVDGAAADIAFSWDAAAGATGYYVDIAESSADLEGMTGTFHNHDNGAATSFDWTGLAQGTTYYWRVWAYNANGGVHAYPAGPVTTPRASKRLLLGLGRGGGGRVEVINGSWAHEAWASVQWAAYNAANGALKPACGDLKGDGKEEVVCALGTYPAAGGYLAVLDNTTYAVLKWIRIPWSSYDTTDGETRAAVGDFDGDGNAEIAVGISSYTASGGWVYLFGGAQTNYAYRRAVRLPWTGYNTANGSTRPAIGDLDGDGKCELVVGLGSYPGYGGYCAIFGDAAAGFAFQRWVRVDWTAYNAANGDVRPACGDLDGDGRADLVLGLGSYTVAGGYARVLSDANANFAGLGWVHTNWTWYNSANGETRPAIGDAAGTGHNQIALGLGMSKGMGYVYIAGDASQGFAGQRWVRVSDVAYDSANGETWPAFGRIR